MAEYGGSGDPARSMRLLWGLEPGQDARPRRGPRPRLTVPAITRAAVEVADAEGLAALSMRRVAERLGVAPMSLYTYVPGKAELLDLMYDLACAETERPAGVSGGWRGRLEQVAWQNWALYHRHPWMVQVSFGRPVLGPNVIAKYDYELRAVEGVGLSDVEMDSVLTLVLGHVAGTARGVLEAAEAERRTGLSDLRWWEAHAPYLKRVFDPERFPTAARVGAAAGEEHQAAYDPAHAFAFGLRRVLDGVGVLIASRG